MKGEIWWKTNHYYLIFLIQTLWSGYFLLRAVYRLKCWELKQQQRRRQRERLKSNSSRVCLHGGERGVRWNNPLSWGYPPAYIIFHFSNESGRTLTATTCQFFFWGGGEDDGVNAGYFLPLLIGLHHLPRVHVNKPVNQQNNNFTRASRFLYISFPSSHDCDVLKKLHVLLRIDEHDTRTFFFFSWTSEQSFRIQL